jgi:hypothetical protein
VARGFGRTDLMLVSNFLPAAKALCLAGFVLLDCLSGVLTVCGRRLFLGSSAGGTLHCFGGSGIDFV